MASIQQILNGKPPGVATIAPQATVYSALEMMAEREIGALPVVENGRLVGMFSERDYARKVELLGRASRSTAVSELMTSKVYYVQPDQTIEDCMALMTDKHIRHLPVMDGEKLVGLISIGDVVKSIIIDQEITIRSLQNYITGSNKV